MSVVDEKFLPTTLSKIMSAIQDMQNTVVTLTDIIERASLSGLSEKIDALTSEFANLKANADTSNIEDIMSNIQNQVNNIEDILIRMDNLENQNNETNNNVKQLQDRIANVEAVSDEFFDI